MLSRNDMGMIAPLIAELNQRPGHHIGYCGTDKEELLHSLLELHEEAGVEQIFVVAFDDNRLVGVVGFDPDEEQGVADNWGLFVQHDKWLEVADVLWQEIKERFFEVVK